MAEEQCLSIVCLARRSSNVHVHSNEGSSSLSCYMLSKKNVRPESRTTGRLYPKRADNALGISGVASCDGSGKRRRRRTSRAC